MSHHRSHRGDLPDSGTSVVNHGTKIPRKTITAILTEEHLIRNSTHDQQGGNTGANGRIAAKDVVNLPKVHLRQMCGRRL